MGGMTPDEFGNFIGQMTEDPKAAELAKEIATDPIAARDKVRVPDDAGEYEADLEDILRRIPRGYFRSIDCGKGWYPLLVQTHKRLLAIDPDYEVHQVKEKFGGLRYYHAVHTDKDYQAAWDIEADAERKSYTICEICGAPGYARAGGWIRTLCDEHGDGRPKWDDD